MAIPYLGFKMFGKNKKGDNKTTKTTITNNYAAPTAAPQDTMGSEEERRKRLQAANVLGTSSGSSQEGSLL